MRKIDIAILYQHVPRELDVTCAVASIVRRDFGLTAEIIQWPCGVPEALGRFRPRLVVLPFCYHWSFFGNLLAEWRTATFLNLAWEQLLYEGNRGGKTPKEEFALRHVVHHAWNVDYATYLRELGVPDANVWLNGHPGYMLYLPPYRNYFKNRLQLAREHGLDPAKRWVFFPENYNWAYYSEAILQDFIRAGTKPEDAATMRDYCRRSLHDVLRWLDTLAQDSWFEVLVRPRPLTPLADFQQVVADIAPGLSPKLRISKAESVREWILASDVVVSSYSTSLIEAGVAGKPSYMLEPAPLPKVMEAAWHSRLPRVRNLAELEAVSAGDRPPDENAVGLWAKDYMLGRGDPIWRIAERIAKSLSRGESLPPVTPRWAVSTPGRLPLPQGLLYEYRRLKYRGQRRDPESMVHERYRHQNDIVADAEIERRIQLWDVNLAGYRPALLAPASGVPVATSA